MKVQPLSVPVAHFQPSADDLSEFDEALACGLEWMWADAAVLPGLEWLARKNPLRWEKLEQMRVHEWSTHFRSLPDDRPVHLRVSGRPSPFQTFESAQDASRWILFCAQSLDPLETAIGSLDCLEGLPAYPPYWANCESQSRFKDTILLPSEALPLFQQLVDTSYVPVSTRDRPCPARPPCAGSRKVAGGCV
eukprot:CAMPEP_0179140874 /NCGR_PEP_ID=MMETSP0796-20121207/67509_1 /TAXON_ID=73915 /ORGANISM="Pyrodinium bahamense, Strain pbaha01" /LENGTH=191 /DNA_ID=CAMNT_0020840507 /DNA_START=105 /DNA_END=676 /DNA_ORIENTATION=+